MLYSVAATIHQLEQPKSLNKNSVEILYYHTDHLGTPRELTNRDGCIVWADTYKAWGNTAKIQRWEEQENPVEQNLRFQGQYYDQETGLHYNRFRYYDPDCGRFLSQDPIGLWGGVNNYQYAPNPVEWIDPFGLCTCPGHIGAGFSIDDLSQAASAPDRNGLTAAGRALQKHGSRSDSVFPAAKGSPASINKQGQDIVDDILTSPRAMATTRNHARYGDVIEVRAPDGRGVRYDSDGKLMGLLEP